MSDQDAITNADPHGRPQSRVFPDVTVAPHGDPATVREGKQLSPNVRVGSHGDAVSQLTVRRNNLAFRMDPARVTPFEPSPIEVIDASLDEIHRPP
jgi:hypothetical protein